MSNTLQQIVEMVVKVTDQGSATLKKSAKGMKEYDNALDNANKQSDKTEKSAKKAAKGVKTLGTQTDKTTKNTKSATAAQNKMNKSLRKTEVQSKKTGKSLKGYSSYAGGLTSAFATLAVTVAAIGFPVVKAAKFERKMSEVKAISGATTKEFVMMSEEARRLGKTTEYSATQAAEGLKYLTMAGLSAAEATTALGGALQLAQAGNMDLGRAADIATNILTGFGMEVSELARINDVLVQTFTNTNSTLEELGFAMAYVAPVAAGLGADFDDLSAATGKLHSAGIKGSMAGTTLRGILTRLVAPTKMAAEMMRQIGARTKEGSLELMDAQGNFVGFVALIKQLEEAGATTIEIMKMLGQRAGPGLAALLSQGSAALQKMADLNKTSAGRAATIAKVMHENVIGSWKAFTSAVEEASIAIGNLLLPMLDRLLKSLTAIASKLGDLVKEFPTLFKVLGTLGSGFTALFGVLLLLGGVVSSVTWAFGGIASAVVALATQISALTGAGIVFTGFWASLGAVLTAVVGIVFSVGGALVALGATIAGLTFSDTFRGWIADMELFGVRIGDVAQIFADQFGGSIGVIMDQFGINLQRGMTAVTWFVFNVIDKLKMVYDGWVLIGKGMLLMAESLPGVGGFFKDLREATEASAKQIDVAKRLNNLKKKAITLEETLAESALKVKESYSEQSSALETSLATASKRMLRLEGEFTNLSSQGAKSLAALGTAIDTHVAQAWDAALDDSTAEQYLQRIQDMKTSTVDLGIQAEGVFQNLGHRIGAAQIKSVQSTIASIDNLYDDQIANYKRLLDAQRIDHGKSVEAIVQQEEAIARKQITFAQGIYAKKKEYYQKATTILQSELDKSLALEEGYVNKIKQLKGELETAGLAGEEKLRAIKRQAMTDEQVLVDKRREYNDLMDRGSDLEGSNPEQALEFYKKAIDLAGDLVTETKGGQVQVSEAYKKTEVALEAQKSVQEKMLYLAERAKYAEGARGDVIKDDLDTMAGKLVEVKALLAEGLSAQVKLDTATFDAQLLDISKSKNLYINAVIKVDTDTKAIKSLQEQIEHETLAISIPIRTKGEPELRKLFLDIQTQLVGFGDEHPINVKVSDATKVAADVLKGIADRYGEVGAPVILKIEPTGVEDVDEAVIRIKDNLATLPTTTAPQAVPLVVDIKGEEGIPTLVTNLDEFEKRSSPKLVIRGIDVAISKVKELVQEIAKLKDKTITITQNIKGSAATHSAAGSRVPGFGGGDKHPYMLEGGEWVINKDAVRKFGDGFMSALNSGTLTGLKTGGPIGSAVNAPAMAMSSPGTIAPRTNMLDGLSDFGTVTLDTGTAQIPAVVNKNVIGELTTHLNNLKRFGTE